MKTIHYPNKNKIPLCHNRTYGAVYPKMNFKVDKKNLGYCYFGISNRIFHKVSKLRLDSYTFKSVFYRIVAFLMYCKVHEDIQLYGVTVCVS